MPQSVSQGTRVLGRMSGKPSLLYSSVKAGGILAVESPAEKTVAQLADLDPRVIRLKGQPFTIDVLTGAIYRCRNSLLLGRAARLKGEVKIREYTPDFLIETITGRAVVVEVKLDGFLGDEAYYEKLDKARRILQLNGYELLVIVRNRDPKDALAQNADLLTAFSQNYAGMPSRLEIDKAETLLQQGPCLLGEVCHVVGLSLREAPFLILRGVVNTDLGIARIGAASCVIGASGNLDHLMLLPLDETVT